MNYRHAFHAGNFADCVKHALLVWLLQALGRKAAPFFVLDTHAGAGRYDLESGAAERTGEWRCGIARLLHAPPNALVSYVDLVERLGLYPGSPVLAQALLRPADYLAACELHPDEYAALRRAFRGDPLVSVHLRDGYEAIGALLPPSERRGLVLIDPPFERPDEFERILAALRVGAARFGHGVYAVWYPIKHRTPVRAWHEALRESGLRDMVCAELWKREPTDPGRLNGCGVLVRNPPFGFERDGPEILGALLDRLGDREAGEGTALVRISDE